MDRFIKIVPQKKIEEADTVHINAYNRIKQLIQENKNIFLCGPTGVGKSHLLRQVIDLTTCIEIQTKTMIDYIKDTYVPIVIEDYDAEPIVYKNIIDHVIENGTINKRSMIVNSI